MSTRHVCTKVTLRQRAIRNEKISLYLDYYPAIRNPETMTMSRREYLGIYIYANPKNELERNFNIEMLNKAEAIRCLRVTSLINEEFGFSTRTVCARTFWRISKRLPTRKKISGRSSISTSNSSSTTNALSQTSPSSSATSFATIC